MTVVGMKRISLSIIGAVFLLTGCGGGGGGGGGEDPFVAPTLSDSLVTISADNQNDVVTTVDTGVNGAKEGGSSALGVVIEGTSSTFNVFNFVSTKFSSAAEQAALTNFNVPVGASFSEDIPCDSGSMTFSAEVKNTSSTTLTVGDSLGIRFNSCVDGTTTTKGSLLFTITSGSLDLNCDTGCGDVTASATIRNLRITEAGQSVAVDGGFSVAKSGNTETMSGSSLYVVVTGGEAVHLTDFTISIDSTGPFSDETSTVEMTIASSVLDGVITVTTDPAAPLVKHYYEDHPHSGKVTVTGDNGSQLLIEHLSATSVSLTLDVDGAGPTPAEATVIVTWDVINA